MCGVPEAILVTASCALYLIHNVVIIIIGGGGGGSGGGVGVGGGGGGLLLRHLQPRYFRNN